MIFDLQFAALDTSAWDTPTVTIRAPFSFEAYMAVFSGEPLGDHTRQFNIDQQGRGNALLSFEGYNDGSGWAYSLQSADMDLG